MADQNLILGECCLTTVMFFMSKAMTKAAQDLQSLQAIKPSAIKPPTDNKTKTNRGMC